jgi:hypothetical protein
MSDPTVILTSHRSPTVRQRVWLTSFFVAVLVIGFSRVSFAVGTVYYGSGCQGIDKTSDGHLTRSSGQLTTSTETKVVCPIIKTTSGYGVTSGDAISSVSVYFSSGTSATCSFVTFRVNASSSESDGNIVGTQQSGTVTNGGSISFSGTTIQGYWVGDGGHNSWYYPELYCDITSGTLTEYTVGEDGSDEGYRIASSSNCKQLPTANAYNFSFPPSGGEYGAHSWGGFVEAAYTESSFQMLCPFLSEGYGDQIALGPADTAPLTPPVLMGCVDEDVQAYQTVPFEDYQNFPPEILTFGDMTEDDGLICYMENDAGMGGDGMVFSYRQAPSALKF